MLKEWALMCFSITEETSETLHSALGSSGSFLEGKERDSGYVPSYSNVTTVFYWDTVVHCVRCNLTVTGSQEKSTQIKHAGCFLGWAVLFLSDLTQRLGKRAVVECTLEGVLGSPGFTGQKALSVMFIWNYSLETTHIKHHTWPAQALGLLNIHRLLFGKKNNWFFSPLSFRK